MFKSFFPSPGPTNYEYRTPHKNSWSMPANTYNPSRYIPSPDRDTMRGGHGRRIPVDVADYEYTSPLPAYMNHDPYTSSTPVHLREVKPRTFASETDRMRTKASRTSDAKYSSKLPSKKQKISIDEIDEHYFDNYSPQTTPPPPYLDYTNASYGRYQAYQTYEASPPTYAKTRARATSSPQKPSRQQSTKKPRAAPKRPRVATHADVRRWDLPAYCEKYSLKNWDPEEEPLTLLGSVFDANALGKWIFDWTVFHHGAGSPMADEAGNLWLLLIELTSKRKRAEAALPRIRRRKRRETVREMLDESDELWQRLDALLAKCEHYMWKHAKRQNPASKTTTFGSNSGCEFVDSIFGRDRELETTQKLTNDITWWTREFNEYAEEIVSEALLTKR